MNNDVCTLHIGKPYSKIINGPFDKAVIFSNQLGRYEYYI